MRLKRQYWCFEILRNVLVSVFLLASTLAQPAYADELDDAQVAAIQFLDKIGTSRFKSAWDNDISNWFKEKMTRDAFLANMTMTRAQLGGPGAGRELIQRNKANIPPGGDIPGPIFSFMFSATYPSANIYESVVLIREEGKYKITGFNFVPNPN